MTLRGLHALNDKPMRIEPVPLVLRIAIALLLALAASAGNAANSALQAPADLAADGAQADSRGQPVVILFSLPGCHYCDVVRQHYLAPLLRDAPEHARPVIREVQVNGRAAFAGFDRARTTHNAFAARHGVRFAPTVMFFDRHGNPIAQPIIGGDTAGLYGGYLDNAFAEATRKLTGGQAPHTSGD